MASLSASVALAASRSSVSFSFSSLMIDFLNSKEAACFSSLASLIAAVAADFSWLVTALSRSNLALFSFFAAMASFLRAFYLAIDDDLSVIFLPLLRYSKSCSACFHLPKYLFLLAKVILSFLLKVSCFALSVLYSWPFNPLRTAHPSWLALCAYYQACFDSSYLLYNDSILYLAAQTFELIPDAVQVVLNESQSDFLYHPCCFLLTPVYLYVMVL